MSATDNEKFEIPDRVCLRRHWNRFERFETQLLSFAVHVAGLAYGYRKCLDFFDTRLMCHVTLEGSDISYDSAPKLINDKLGEKKGRNLTVKSVRMNEKTDTIPTKDGYAALTKLQ
ncbi:hypothetical protein LTR06_011079 [Exophiala xenobiotica]|nr:hypothetical protein LTR06_011079 [Exophiala xenobiotica]